MNGYSQPEPDPHKGPFAWRLIPVEDYITVTFLATMYRVGLSA